MMHLILESFDVVGFVFVPASRVKGADDAHSLVVPSGEVSMAPSVVGAVTQLVNANVE